jgi:hypothetical protein
MTTDETPTRDERTASETASPDRSLGRRAGRAGRIVMMIAAVVLIVIGASASLTGIFESSRTTTARYDGEVGRLVVRSGNGEIVVTATDTAEIEVQRDERYVFRRPSRVADVEGGTLTVEDGCPSFNLLFLGGCRVDFRITVPVATAIDLDSSNGDLVVEGIEDAIVVRTSNGDIDLDRVAGPTEAVTSNGSIIGRGLETSAVRADTSNGRISLVFASIPDRVDADTSNGDIDIALPDAPYRIEADTSNGDVDVQVVSDPGAPRSITATSSNGNIDIRRR